MLTRRPLSRSNLERYTDSLAGDVPAPLTPAAFHGPWTVRWHNGKTETFDLSDGLVQDNATRLVRDRQNGWVQYWTPLVDGRVYIECRHQASRKYGLLGVATKQAP